MADTTQIISGNLAAPPDLKFSQAGKPWVKFTIMVNERREQNGQWVEVAKNGMRCVAFGDLAEHIAESFPDGKARVIAAGRLVPQQWQDRETGANRYDWQLHVEDIGPSLKWATATPVKAQRHQQAAPQGGYGQPQGDPWAGGASPQQGGASNGFDSQPPF